MKLKYLFLAILTSLLFIFCSKSGYDGYDRGRRGTMQAKVDGSLIVCDSIVHLRTGFGETLYGVDGYKKGPIGFKLIFPISHGVVRTYPFSDMHNEGWLVYGHSHFQYRATSGSVIITEATGNGFKGTFSFTAEKYDEEESKIVSEGSFEIK